MIFFTIVGSLILGFSIISLPLSKKFSKPQNVCPMVDAKNDLKMMPRSESKPSNVFCRLDSAVDVQDSTLMEGLKNLKENPADVSDEIIISLLDAGKIAGYSLEKTLGDFNRAVKIRRRITCMHYITNHKPNLQRVTSRIAFFRLIIMTTQRYLACAVKT